MKQRSALLFLAVTVLAVCASPKQAMAETNQSTAARWLAKADLASPFQVPGNRLSTFIGSAGYRL